MALDPGEIHYGIRGQRFGPVDLNTLVLRLRAGQLSADDFLWDDEVDDWVSIRRYAVLLASLHQNLPDEIDPADPRLTALPADHAAVAPAGAELVPASFAIRTLAYLIDGLTLLIPITFWIFFAEDYTGFDVEAWATLKDPTDAETSVFLNYLFLSQLGVFLIHGIYHSLLESSSWQATLGKRAMGICVTDEAGRRISPGRAFGRHCGRLLCELTLFAGYLVILFSERGQGFHDRVAGTLVVRKD
jgi:uncharacterized RDD family membrane protein YckC